jgi:hypothetical protein
LINQTPTEEKGGFDKGLINQTPTEEKGGFDKSNPYR